MNTTKQEKQIRKRFIMERDKAVLQVNTEEWHVGNKIFAEYVRCFDSVFTNLSYLPSDYYVTRPYKDNREYTHEDYISKALFSDHIAGSERIYIIQAPVGRGKSELCNYIGNQTLPKKYGKNFIYINIDCHDRFVGGEAEIIQLENEIKESILSHILNHRETFKCENQADFGKLYYSYNTRGVEVRDNQHAVDEYQKSSLKSFLKFVLNNFSQEEDIIRILLVLDNIDECHIRGVSNAKSIATRVSKYTNNCKGGCSVLIPMREYTAKAIDTTRYPNLEIPSINIYEMVRLRLIMMNNALKKEVDKSFNKIEQESISVNVFNTKKHRYDKIYNHKRVTFSAPIDFSENLLLKISLDSNSEIKDDFAQKIIKLSGGNYKTVIYNLYYMIHSCKLNLTKLVKYAFTECKSEEYLEHIDEFMKLNISNAYIYDLLMAVHTPFFDSKTSLIPNLFKIETETEHNDYKDTLACIRILSYVNNKKRVSLYQIISFFKEYAFDYERHIKPSINKLMESGLISANSGLNISHLDDESIVTITESGEYYTFDVLKDKRYYEFIFDDVYMEKKFIIPIQNRYTKGKTTTNISKLNDFFYSSINFLKHEEIEERKSIECSEADYKIYSNSCMLSHGKEKLLLSEIMDRLWKK